MISPMAGSNVSCYLTPLGFSILSTKLSLHYRTFPNGGFETNPTRSNGWSWPSTDWVWDGNIAHSGAHSARIYRGSGMQQPVCGLLTYPCNLRLFTR